jgi:XapX domain-containing protein
MPALFDFTNARSRLLHSGDVRGRPQALVFRREKIVKIAIGFVLSFIIGAGCRYFDIPAASPPVIPGALIVLAMTLGYTSMDRLLIRKDRAATTKHLCGGATGLPPSIASSMQQSQPEARGRS